MSVRVEVKYAPIESKVTFPCKVDYQVSSADHKPIPQELTLGPGYPSYTVG